MSKDQQVWVTLRGEHVHVQPDCPGILDGHAKARRAGHQTYEPEPWPPQLALSGKPDGQVRTPCERCCGNVTLGTQDDPDAVRLAMRGRIFQSRYEYARRRAQWQARQQLAPPPDPDDPGQTVVSGGQDSWAEEPLLDVDLETIASMYVPLDADDGDSFYH